MVVETLGVELCKVLELQPGGERLLLRAGVGWQEGAVGRALVGAGKDSQAGYTLLSEEPVIVTDLRHETRFSGPSLLHAHGVVSGLSVIIPAASEPFGVLGAHTREPRTFTHDDTRFLQSVANLLATAIGRLKAEGALRTSRDQLGIILQGVADGITVQDRSGRLVFANNAAARIIGYESAEALLKAPMLDFLARFELLDEAGQPFSLERLPGRLALAEAKEASELVRFRVVATGEENWSLVKATPVFDESGQVEMAVNIFQVVTELKRAEWSQRILAEAGKLLTASLDYEQTLAILAQMAVPNLADWCAIHVLAEDNSIEPLVVAHADPEKVNLAQAVQRRYPPTWDSANAVARVLRSGQAEFYPDITEEMLAQSARDPEHYRLIRQLQPKSVIILPLAARGRSLGTLTLIWTGPRRRYAPADIALAEELARRAALAIDNARLYGESQKLNAELEAQVSRRTGQLQSVITKLRSEIAERKRAEEALRKSEALLKSLFDSAPDATILVSREGLIEDVNAQVETMFGYPKVALIGKRVDLLLPHRLRRRHTGLRRAFFLDPRTRQMGAGLELFGMRQDGSEFPVDIMLSPVTIDNELLVISAVRDISERKLLETELAEVQRRLLESGEAERVHLAQELHDGPIQDLYAISYQLEIASGGEEPDSDMKFASETLQRVIAQLRSICGELRPPALAPFGLEKAILAHLDQMREQYPQLLIEHELMSDGQNLPESIRLALFRIYQHAFSNVIRHSGASRLQVNFRFDDQHAILEIIDDGCGFELPVRWVELARKGHLGLVGTVERAEAIGGRVDIISSPGHGTHFRVKVPVAEGQSKVYSRGLFRFRTV
jgi:PAS domain S-box-containing protein